MAKWHTLQNSFLEGEVSPRFVASVNTELRQNALAEALNGIALLQGNITKRMGTQFVFDIDAGPANTARLWPYIDINNRNAVTLWTAGRVRIVSSVDTAPTLRGTPDKAILSGYEQLITNPTFTLGLTGWVDSGTKTVGNVSYKSIAAGGDLVLLEAVVRDRRPDTIEDVFLQQPILISDTTNSLVISTRAQRLFTNVLLPEGARIRVKVGTTVGGAEIIQRFYEVADVLTTNAESVIIPGGVSGQLFVELAMVMNVAPEENVTIEAYRIFLSEFYLYAQVGDPDAPIDVTTPYLDQHLDGLHFIQSPFDDQELIVLHPLFAPYQLFFDSGAGEYVFELWDFIEPIETPWAPNNFPNIAATFQGRLMLTGSVNDPETVWGSASFDWHDFADAGAPTAEDAIAFTSTSRGVNTWMSGFKRFLYGNTTDEFDLAIEGRVLTSNDIGVQQQSSYGSLRNPQKLTIGNSLILPTGGNTALRMMRFSDENGGFVSPDRFLKAEHLGRKVIRRHFHTRDPQEMLWCVMLDGSMSVMSFDEEMGVYAWTHFVTDGRFIDGVAIVDQLGRDVVILVVERVVDGVTKKYVETLTNLRDVQNWQYMDSHTRTFMDSDQTTVGGLGHLEAKEVSVFTDDNYMGTRVVVNGQIEIDAPAAFVDVGLAYNFRAVTLPDGAVTPQTGLTAKKRYSKIGVRGIFSRGPIINGQRPPERAPQAIMNIPQPPELLLNTSVVDMDWSENAIVAIEEPLPLRITIAGIFGKLTSNEV